MLDDEHPVSNIERQASSPVGHPGLGGLGGVSTQAVGASFWLAGTRISRRELRTLETISTGDYSPPLISSGIEDGHNGLPKRPVEKMSQLGGARR